MILSQSSSAVSRNGARPKDPALNTAAAVGDPGYFALIALNAAVTLASEDTSVEMPYAVPPLASTAETTGSMEAEDLERTMTL